jgi:hypothetical protein
MNLYVKTFILISYGGLILGCQNTARKPAVIDSDQDRQIISNAIAAMLYREDALLANNAFSQHNEISLLRAKKMGRELIAPDTFSLWLEQDRCVLVHAEKNNEVFLPTVNCQELRPTIAK